MAENKSSAANANAKAGGGDLFKGQEKQRDIRTSNIVAARAVMQQ